MCFLQKKRHLIWSTFAQGTPFIIYTPVHELPILCYISNPDIKEIQYSAMLDQVAQISPGRPQMPKIGQKCPQIHNFLCIFISLYLSAFIFISLHLSAFLYTSCHFSAFLSIFLHFSTANLGISLHFSPFLCIFLQTSAFHWHGRGDQCCSTIFVTLIIVQKTCI